MLKANGNVSRRLLFFGRNSNLHGFKHVASENGNSFSKFFWIAVLVGSAGCLYLLLLPVVERNAVITFTPDTLYLNWSTTFPGVTVCETQNYRLALKKLTDLYPNLMNPIDFNKKKYITNSLFGKAKCNKEACVSCGELISCTLPWRTIAEKVRMSCDEMVSDCFYNGMSFPCCKKFHLVDSEYGPCYAFNSMQNKQSVAEGLFSVNRSTGPGFLSFNLLADARVSVHSPEELATNNLDPKLNTFILTALHASVNLTFSVVEMHNQPVMQQESIADRQCRYPYEVPDDPFTTYPVYSYSACKLAYDTEHTYHHCGCVHPIRDLSYTDKYCNYTGLNCLSTYEAEKAMFGLDEDAVDEADECLPSCIESEISVIHVARSWAVEGQNSKSAVNIRMASLPTLRYHRDLLRNNLDLVVSIGGMVGLFFGASILSLAETLYLLSRK